MRGKLGEDLKVVQAHNASNFVTTSVTFGKGSIDTQGYKEALVVINLGAIAGSSTFSCKLYENSADDFTTAVPVTGGVLCTAVSSGSNALVGNVLCDQRKRYLWVAAMNSGALAASVTSGSTGFSASVILGKGQSHPESQTLTIDLE